MGFRVQSSWFRVQGITRRVRNAAVMASPEKSLDSPPSCIQSHVGKEGLDNEVAMLVMPLQSSDEFR